MIAALRRPVRPYRFLQEGVVEFSVGFDCGFVPNVSLGKLIEVRVLVVELPIGYRVRTTAFCGFHPMVTTFPVERYSS